MVLVPPLTWSRPVGPLSGTLEGIRCSASEHLSQPGNGLPLDVQHRAGQRRYHHATVAVIPSLVFLSSQTQRTRTLQAFRVFALWGLRNPCFDCNRVTSSPEGGLCCYPRDYHGGERVVIPVAARSHPTPERARLARKGASRRTTRRATGRKRPRGTRTRETRRKGAYRHVLTTWTTRRASVERTMATIYRITVGLYSVSLHVTIPGPPLNRDRIAALQAGALSPQAGPLSQPGTPLVCGLMDK